MQIKSSIMPKLTAALFVLGGITLWFFFNGKIRNASLGQSIILFDFFKSLGLTVISLGAITFIIDLPDWRMYFGERLKEIVIDRKYLTSLNKEELTQLQVDIYKALYSDTDVDKEDSFLDYMQNNIQDLINSPYREHVSSSCCINPDDSSGNVLSYKEKLSYTLRTVGQKNISDIVWTWEEGELIGDAKLRVTFKCPYFTSDETCIIKGKGCKGKRNCKKGLVVVTPRMSKISNTSTTDNQIDQSIKVKDKKNIHKEYGFKDKIANHIIVSDKLQVLLELEYKKSAHNMYAWGMAYPTKEVSLNLVFPKEYDVERFVGGLYEHEYIYKKNENSVIFLRSGWMLPSDGIAFMFFKKTTS